MRTIGAPDTSVRRARTASASNASPNASDTTILAIFVQSVASSAVMRRIRDPHTPTVQSPATPSVGATKRGAVRSFMGQPLEQMS